MWPEEEHEVSQVKECLKRVGLVDICPRCVLRLAGVKSSTELIRAEVEQKEEQPEPKRAKSLVHCRACLGVLQEAVMQPIVEQLARKIRDCPYDSDHFTLAISLPVSLALRSKALEIILSEQMELFNESCVVPIKQVWKWIFSKRVESAVDKRYVTGDACEFYVELKVDFQEEEKEIKSLTSMCEAEYKIRQQKHNVYHMGLITRQGAEKSLKGVTDKKFKEHYPVPPEAVLQTFNWSINMSHNSIYIAGRYNKFSRALPQTPWLVDGQRKADSSVEEELSRPLKSCFQFDALKFSSSGREDVDVRMRGRGRPFLFEVVNPRQTRFTRDEFNKIMSEVNKEAEGLVAARDMQVVSKAEIKLLKEGEDQKTKTYTALCITPEPYDLDQLKSRLEPIKDLPLEQRTPIRVLHRRPDAIRKRSVYHMKVNSVPKFSSISDSDLKRLFKLELATQAGTYGRTTPNLESLLGYPVDIVALDVEEIHLDWPKRLDDGDSE